MSKILYENIRGLHLEPTNKCSAACSMCNRNYRGKVRDNLISAELSLEDCEHIFDEDFLKQLELVSLCGVYGDSIYARDIHEIIKYFRSANPEMVMNLYTNGSAHSAQWWKDLVKTLGNGSVVFGLDGIDETHSVHRRNTNFDTIINNAKTFIDAGGIAEWDFIAFKHNEHQVEEAQRLSQKIGFSKFNIKKTSRFFKNLYESDHALESTILPYGKHPIYNAEGQLIDCLELPQNKLFRNSAEDKLFSLIEIYGSLENYFDMVGIDCQAIKTNGVFVSAHGDVYPCCNTYQQVEYGPLHGVVDPTELNEYKMQLDVEISAKNYPIRKIVEGDFFKKLISSWELPNIHDGKPKVCSRNCGVEVDMHKATHN